MSSGGSEGRQLIYKDDDRHDSELKPVKLRVKIDLVSYPARAEGVGKYDDRHDTQKSKS